MGWLVPEIDLRSSIGPVRDQGPRPTCMAFTGTCLRESELDVSDVLSPQWLYHFGNKHSGGLGGMTVGGLAEALGSDGNVPERQCPYQTTQDLNWSPPAGLSGGFRARLSASSADFDIATNTIRNHRTVGLALYPDDSFFYSRLNSNGLLVQPSNRPRPGGGHAVTVVGLAKWEGDTILLLRNSWGDGWGHLGYAYIGRSHFTSISFAQFTLEHPT